MKKPQPKIIEKKLGRHKAFGLANDETNKIHIDSRLRGKTKLATYIHEYFHILFPDFSENRILELESQMAEYLWKLNYRQVDNKKR